MLDQYGLIILGEILFFANLYGIIRYSLFNIFREGDATKLMVDLIVNPTNESLTDKNPLSERIHKVAGPLLREECRNNLQSKSLFYIFLFTFIYVCMRIYIRVCCKPSIFLGID